MAAGVNVALCPWLLYRSYICPVRESRHFTPAKTIGRPKRSFSRLFFCIYVASPCRPSCSGPLPIFSCFNLYVICTRFSRDSCSIILFYIISGSGRTIYIYVIFCGILFLQKRLWEFDDYGPADHRRYHGLPADVPHLLPANPLLLRRTFHRHMWVDNVDPIQTDVLQTSNWFHMYTGCSALILRTLMR